MVSGFCVRLMPLADGSRIRNMRDGLLCYALPVTPLPCSCRRGPPNLLATDTLNLPLHCRSATLSLLLLHAPVSSIQSQLCKPIK